jgi:hypothetical protein
MLNKETKHIQGQLANYCRNEDSNDLPEIRPDRLLHYRRLIYNIINDAIESAYPITRSIVSDENWKYMIDCYVTEHPCSNPQLFKMPGEFIDFAQSKAFAETIKLPYLYDLLNFEWIEVEVHSMPDVPEQIFSLEGDFIRETLVFTPYFELLQLEYPIHQLKTTDITKQKGNYFMLVYREDNGTVQYLELNLLTHHLVKSMHQHGASLLEVLNPELEGLESAVQDKLIDQSQYFIFQLKSKGIIKGVANNS